MTPPVWVDELAARFWKRAGPPPPCPRDLTAAALAGFRLRVVTWPDLRWTAVRAWLARLGISCPSDQPDRLLRGCLMSRAGAGFIFVDAADPPQERRFTVAHEIAHFLRDHDAVRRVIETRVGPAALDILDGKRPATVDERLRAVLTAVPLTAHVHLLKRDNGGYPVSAAEQEAEARADRLAFELLAPADRLGGCGAITARLETEFGLPPRLAEVYAAILRPPTGPTDPFVGRLRKFQ